MRELTPKQIVAELDRYIVGQDAAKRAVAVAIRNRWRRQQLPPETAKEVNPKNIIMIGPTGVGKTEIARRIAALTGAPFIKIEATKYTEVGYHGRDVESMVRDLLEQSIGMVRAEYSEKLGDKAKLAVEEKLLDLLLPDGRGDDAPPTAAPNLESADRRAHARAKMLEQLRAGTLEDREVEFTISTRAVPVAMFGGMGMEQVDPELSKVFENLIPERTHRKRLPIREARRVMMQHETETLLDREKLTEEAIRRAEQTGIIFVDEIDKVATPGGSGTGGGRGPDVSRQGVQRDLLPIVEGTAVNTRHGVVNTDHILFIAAGAFHGTAVSDLMPELQGRFPIRVELQPLTKSDFVRILTEPRNALTNQQAALLGTEGLELTFHRKAIDSIAQFAADVNQRSENIGARRLMTVMEKLLEEVSFNAPEMVESGKKKITVTETMVRGQLASIAKDEDLSRFVL